MNLEMSRDLIDVTSNHRPDTNWVFRDSAGHEHRWYEGEKPATYYKPQVNYTCPTLEWVSEGTEYFPDGSPYEFGHYACPLCDETITPGHKADTTVQYISGLMHFYIDVVEVSESEARKSFPELEGLPWSQ